jgi:hypothetical protein
MGTGGRDRALAGLCPSTSPSHQHTSITSCLRAVVVGPGSLMKVSMLLVFERVEVVSEYPVPGASSAGRCFRDGRRADVTLPWFDSGGAMTKGTRHRPEAVISGRVLRPEIPYGKPGATHGHPMIRIGTAATDQGNRICIFIAPNVLWLCRSKCFLPPISKDKRGSVRHRGPRARIQAIGDKGDRLIGVHPCLSAAKNTLALVNPSPAVAGSASQMP